MSNIRFWLGMDHRGAVKRNDKLLVGNIDTGASTFVDVSELLAALTADDLQESATRKYISQELKTKLENLGEGAYTLEQLAQYFYPKNANPAGYLTALSDLAAAKLNGVLAAENIPDLPASKTTSGTFAAARIPSLPASQIGTGVFDVARIPNLPADKFEGIALELAKYILKTAIGAANGVTPLDANLRIPIGYVPDMDAAKITSGVFPEARIPDVYVRANELIQDYFSKAQTEAFTLEEKNKLAGLESPRWKGNYLTPAALRLAWPEGEESDWHNGEAGFTADVDAGVGQLVQRYTWDASDFVWREGASGGGSDSSALVKAKYESNEDTNAFQDHHKVAVEGLPAIVESTAGAQAKADAAKIAAQNYSDLRSDGLEGRILNNENNKVDKIEGEGLTPEKFTLAEKQKLAAVEDPKWKGLYLTVEALRLAWPEGAGQNWHQNIGGWVGDVDSGVGADVARYLWDATDLKWVPQLGTGTAETAESVRTKYLSNAGVEELTTILKGYYDAAYNWVNTNGADVLARLGVLERPPIVVSASRALASTDHKRKLCIEAPGIVLTYPAGGLGEGFEFNAVTNASGTLSLAGADISGLTFLPESSIGHAFKWPAGLLSTQGDWE